MVARCDRQILPTHTGALRAAAASKLQRCSFEMRSTLRDRAFEFGVAAVRLYAPLAKFGPPYAHIALQLVRAGTSIGAQLEEGSVPYSRRDMASKHLIGLREAKESLYWLRVLTAVNVRLAQLPAMLAESDELVAMLTTSVKKLRDEPS